MQFTIIELLLSYIQHLIHESVLTILYSYSIPPIKCIMCCYEKASTYHSEHICDPHAALLNFLPTVLLLHKILHGVYITINDQK